MTEIVIALLVGLVLHPVVTRILTARSVLDRPNQRSSHSVPTPRGGGIAIVAGVLAALSATGVLFEAPLPVVASIALLFAAIGFIDDLRGLPAVARLVAQIGGATVGTAALAFVLDWAGWWLPVVVVAATAWTVGFTNVFNFMDGINGIAAAQAGISGAAFLVLGSVEDLTVVAALGGATVGAAAGFAPFNFPKARVFLGDVGSYFLGAWLALTAVVGFRAGLPPEACGAPFALYVSDVAVTLLRRVRRGAPWREAHREHVYQRLVIGGWSHTQTTTVVAVAVVCCSALGSVSLSSSVVVRALADVGIVAVVIGYLFLPAMRIGPAPKAIVT